jgi:hypothetical protein
MVTEQINSLRQEREAAVIGGLLLGGLTPNAQDVLATLDPEVFTIPLYKRAPNLRHPVLPDYVGNPLISSQRQR